jgi:two-component system sensor histidine kinase CiaH
MFRRLQVQFILTNLTIITVLVGSLTLGAYILLQHKMVNHAEFFAKNMATGINAGMFPEMAPDHPEGRHFGGNPADPMHRPPEPPLEPPRDQSSKESFFFFIETDSNWNITYHSLRFPVRSTQLNQLVKELAQTRKNSGLIRLFRSAYFYYKTPLRREKGTLLIFQDIRKDQQNQRSLVIALMIAGSVYLVLALFGSVFMARRAIDPIQKAWQQQKGFLADASHELRNPLAVIQTNLEVVLDNQTETVAEQREWLDNIQDELRQMTELVTSLLFLARIDSHQRVMEKKRFQLDMLLVRVCEAFKPVAALRKINLATAITAKVSAYGDESAIRQVMENLLDNAVRHTPDGGTITVKLELTAKKIVLTVADTGEGIAATYLPKIFDRFYQVESARSKGKSGLGLTIVKSIVENHDGTIQVASQPGVGTTFMILLPVVKEANLPVNGNSIGSDI